MSLRILIRAKPELPVLDSEPNVAVIERRFSIPDADVVIGRQAGAGIELPFARVSQRHARLSRVGGALHIEDLGSSNGTFLLGRRIAPNVGCPVALGETIRLADVELVVESDDGSLGADGSSDGTETVARRLVHDLFEVSRPAEHARLEVLSGPLAGRELSLLPCGRSFTLGRGEDVDFVLPDDDVSRVHLGIERSAQGGIWASDLESKNGVFVAGERIAAPRVLHDGDTIRIGETHLQLHDPEERYLRKLQTQDDSAEATPAADPLTSYAAGLSAAAGRFSTIATMIAVGVLLLALSLVLALAFAAQV